MGSKSELCEGNTIMRMTIHEANLRRFRVENKVFLTLVFLAFLQFCTKYSEGLYFWISWPLPWNPRTCCAVAMYDEGIISLWANNVNKVPWRDSGSSTQLKIILKLSRSVWRQFEVVHFNLQDDEIIPVQGKSALRILRFHDAWNGSNSWIILHNDYLFLTKHNMSMYILCAEYWNSHLISNKSGGNKGYFYDSEHHNNLGSLPHVVAHNSSGKHHKPPRNYWDHKMVFHIEPGTAFGVTRVEMVVAEVVLDFEHKPVLPSEQQED